MTALSFDTLRSQLLGHISATVADLQAGRVFPEETAAHLLFLADLYAAQVVAVRADGVPANPLRYRDR